MRLWLRDVARAFTLAEIMVAMLFICIAMFGYISLHLRIIHSGMRLEEHEEVRNIHEKSLLNMTVRSRIQDAPDTTQEIKSQEGAPLRYSLMLRWSHPEASLPLQRLESDIRWTNDYGEHGLHVETYSRRFQWSW